MMEGNSFHSVNQDIPTGPYFVIALSHLTLLVC
jgi:hypothetical protein